MAPVYAQAGLGFTARRLLMPAGVFETTGANSHTISLHVGAPIHANCLRGGRLRRTLQSPGDIEIIPAGEPGRWEDEAPAEIISMKIEPSFLDSIASGMGLDPRRVELAPQTKVRDSQIVHIGRALEAALADPKPEKSLLIDSLGVALGARLIQLYSSSRAQRPPNMLSRRQMQAVVDFIEANLASPLRLDDLARVAEMGMSNFKTLFKNTSGVSAHQYVISRRIERAAALIRQGGLPLSQIALDAGFSHQSHLARAMRKALGVTPGSLSRTLL